MAASLKAAAQNGVFSLVVSCLKDQKTIADLLKIKPTAGASDGGLSPSADAWDYARNVGSFFESAAVGAESINVSYADGSVSGFATGTITFTGNPANADTLVIGGVTITFVTTLTTGAQVKLGATQAATMANLIAYLNAGGVASEVNWTSHGSPDLRERHHGQFVLSRHHREPHHDDEILREHQRGDRDAGGRRWR